MEFSGYQDNRGGQGNPSDIFSNVQGGAAGALGMYMNQALVPRPEGSAGAYYYSPSGGAGFSGGGGGFGGASGGRAAPPPLPSNPVVPPGSMAGTALPGATPGVPGAAASVGGGVAAAGAGAGMGMGITNSALLWLTGISAGTSLLGAWIQANAAKDAAAAQERLGREALALQERMWKQSRNDMAPYTSAGAGASNTLAGLMGIPLQPAAEVPSTTPPGPGERRRPPDAPIIGYAVPRPDAPPAAWDRYNERERTRQAGAGATTGAAAARTSGYATMRAPDGSVAQVPAEQVAFAIRRGATRV